MVVKYTDKGTAWIDYPYSKEEIAEMEARVSSPPTMITSLQHPAAAPQAQQEAVPQEEKPHHEEP